MRTKNKPKKDKNLGKFVILSLSILILYTISEMIVSSITGIEHTTLTTCVFAAFGGETLFCCLIKLFKLKGEYHGYNNEVLN